MIHRPIASAVPDIDPDRLAVALEFLSRDDLAELALGRYDLAEGVFANVQQYESVAAAEKDYEAHRAYFDVQFVVHGQEYIEVAPLAECVAVGEFDEANDYGLYTCPAPASKLVMREGDWCVLGPDEAHKPGCALGDPMTMRKVVVKVALD
jgi:YhcH/YjgK/YiaL family protein